MSEARMFAFADTCTCMRLRYERWMKMIEASSRCLRRCFMRRMSAKELYSDWILIAEVVQSLLRESLYL